MTLFSTTPAKHIRRRQVVVKRGFQYKYAVIMFLIFGLAAFMVWWEIYDSFRSLIAQGLIQHPLAKRMVDEISRMVLYKVMMALGLVWFLSILLSHYLAGPIYRLEACLKLLKEGDLTHRAQFRPKDEFKSLAVDYNAGVESLQFKITALRDAAFNSDPQSGLERVKHLLRQFKI